MNNQNNSIKLKNSFAFKNYDNTPQKISFIWWHNLYLNIEKQRFTLINCNLNNNLFTLVTYFIEWILEFTSHLMAICSNMVINWKGTHLCFSFQNSEKKLFWKYQKISAKCQIIWPSVDMYLTPTIFCLRLKVDLSSSRSIFLLLNSKFLA